MRPAEGEQLRNGRHPPGEEAWLVGEHRTTGERKSYLSNLPAEVTLEGLAATIKARPRPRLPPAVPAATDRARCARWACEQAHQQLKEELGLGHFEGRSPRASPDARTCGDGAGACCAGWAGLHRHALMAMIAFAFLQYLRLGERGEKRGRTAGTATTTDIARGPTLAARALPRRPDLLPQLRG